MGNSDRCRFYAVHGGTSPGVYTSWLEASQHCHKVPGAIAKGFNDRRGADTWVRDGPIDSKNWYAVPGEGVYNSWAEAKPRTEGRLDHSQPVKKFETHTQAEEYMVLCGCVKLDDGVDEGARFRDDAIDGDYWYAVPAAGIYVSWHQAKPKAEARDDQTHPARRFRDLKLAQDYMASCGYVKGEDMDL